MFLKKNLVYSLNFVSCLHLAINSLLLFNNLLGNLWVKICIFSSKHKLHLQSKLFGVFDFHQENLNVQLLNDLLVLKELLPTLVSLDQIILYIYIYIYIYIVTHRQTCLVISELFSVARLDKFSKLGSKSGWLKRQSKILPLSHEETSAGEGNLNAYESHLVLFTYICLTATECSIHMKSLATITSLARELNPSGVGDHMYCHPQTDLFRSIRTLQCD